MLSTISLTPKQKEELNKAILQYLYKSNFEETAEKFQSELGIQYEQEDSKQKQDILERKWYTSGKLFLENRRLNEEIKDLKEQVEKLIKNPMVLDGSQNINIKSGLNKDELINPYQKFELNRHRKNITRVAFHRSQPIFASCSEDGTMILWDADGGELEHIFKSQHTGVVNSVSFDYSGKYMVSASSDQTLKIFDLESKVCMKTLQGHDHSVAHGEFSLDGNYVLSCSRDKTIKLWEVNSGYCKKTMEGHDQWVRYLKFSPDGDKFATCSDDQSIIIWNYNNLEPMGQIENAHDNVIEIVQWLGQHSLQNSEILKKAGNSTHEESKESDVSQTNGNNIKQQQYIYLASGGRDNRIHIWNTQKQEKIFTFKEHDNWIKGIAFHPYLQFMYTASDDRSIRVCNLKTGKQFKKVYDAHTNFVSSLDIGPSSCLKVITGGYDMKVKVWDLKY